MKRILLSLLTLTVLASCSKEPATTPVAADGIIRVVAGVAATRAVADASTGLTGASFIVVKGNQTPPSFAGGTAYMGDVAAVSGEVTFTAGGIPTYDLDGQHAWFVAFVPGGALTDNVIEWTIDGKTDIMVTNNVWDAGTYFDSAWRGLNFNHRLSQVEVVCQSESEAPLSAVRDNWGEITKIEFVGASTTMKYDLSATPVVSVSGSADLPLLADYNGTPFASIPIPASGNTTANVVAMLAPVKPTATESFRLRVTTSGTKSDAATPITMEIPVSLNGSAAAMTAGRKHKVTLTFRAKTELINVTVTYDDDWVPNGDVSGDIGEASTVQ